MRTTSSDTHLAALRAKRAEACRLTPDRALETLEEAAAFLHERGLLTRTTCCSLPSLFEACHEEPYAHGKPGFGQWPRTKWGWSFALPRQPGVYALKIHHRHKSLFVTAEIARLIDPIVRDELERMRGADPDWALVLDHLAGAGPSTSDDLKTELGLKPRELKAILYPLELCGTIVGRATEPTEEGMVEGFEYARWDDVFPDPAPRVDGLAELIVAGVRAAVVATEREVTGWFPWKWRLEPDLVDGLVNEGRLERPASGWLAAPEGA